MSSIICKKCLRDIDGESTHCPNCNAPIELFNIELNKVKDTLSKKKEESITGPNKELKGNDQGREHLKEEKQDIKFVDNTSRNRLDTIKSLKEKDVSADRKPQKLDSKIKQKKIISVDKKLDTPLKTLDKEKIDEPYKINESIQDKPGNKVSTEIDKKPEIEYSDKSTTNQVPDKKPVYKTHTKPTTITKTEPPEIKTTHKAIKSHIPASQYILVLGVIMLIVGAGFVFYNRSGDSNIVEKDRQKKLEHFTKNRQEIIDDINSQLHKNNYGNAQKIAREYLYINDPEINKMYVKARKEYLMIELSKLTSKWDNYEIPQSIPTDDTAIKLHLDIKQVFREKRRIYDELIKIDQQNAVYKEKFQNFSNKYDQIDYKFKELNERQAEAKKRQESIDKQFDRVEGSHINLEMRIKSNMKYPDSFVHIKSAYEDKESYLIVSTTYQGKDIYGQVVIKTVKARVSLDGVVERIISEY